ARAWWLIAAQAGTQEEAMVAMQRAAQSTRVIVTSGMAPRRLAQATELSIREFVSASIDLTGIQAAVPAYGSLALTKACGARGPLPARVAQACQVFVLHYMALGPDHVDKAIAMSLAKRWHIPETLWPYSESQLKKVRKAFFNKQKTSEITQLQAPPSHACARAKEMFTHFTGNTVGEFEFMLEQIGGMPPR
ncbi:MAG: hypothetical protein ABW220_12045, partial [Burkholderiaceae bacterium]